MDRPDPIRQSRAYGRPLEIASRGEVQVVRGVSARTPSDGRSTVAQLSNRQRATIGGAVAVFLGALIAAAALAQSTRNQSDQTPANGALFAAESPSPSVSVSPSVSLSPSVSVSPSPTASPVPSV